MCGAFAASFEPVQAQEASEPGPATSAKGNAADWVRALIVTDGAAVYAKPDFDSQVQDYLGYQTKVFVSKRPYAGQGGMGLFHRIHYQNKMGYIPDTDVRVNRKEVEKEVEKKKSPSKAFNKDEDDKPGEKPIYLTRYLGGAISRVHFAEKYSGHKLSDQMMMYGLRMTGPGTLFDGPPLDFNLWFSLQKPRYFNTFATGNPTGFLLFGDVQAMMPLIDIKNTIVNYGLGIMWVYTRYNIPVRSAASGNVSNFDSQEFRVGVDVGLGVGQRFGRALLRADVKYYVEKTQYAGLMTSLQMEY